MFNLNLSFYICDTVGFLRLMYLVKVIINFIRFAVPFILIFMTIFDLFKNVINPKDKEGMKKITNRLVAAVIVFFIPTLVNLVVYLIDYIFENENTNYKITSCYTNSNKSCINNLDNYFDCNEISSDNKDSKKNCKKYRSCNSYTLTDGCRIETVEKEDCSKVNQEFGMYKQNGYYNPNKY